MRGVLANTRFIAKSTVIVTKSQSLAQLCDFWAKFVATSAINKFINSWKYFVMEVLMSVSMSGHVVVIPNRLKVFGFADLQYIGNQNEPQIT